MTIRSLSFPAGQDSEPANRRDVLLFMISGNPGLIDYYEPFLATLRDRLGSSPAAQAARFHIYGQDLQGFDDNDHVPFNAQNPPRNVEDQINYLLKTLYHIKVADGPNKGKPYDEVVVMAHSVGSYLTLSMFHRLLRDPDLAPHVNLKTGILLFPTIEHIKQSNSGVKLDLLRQTPVLGANAHLIASTFLRLVPQPAVYWIVNRLMGFPAHAAAVTTRFLKSRDGVWQALHLGMDEMQVINEDVWDERLWAIADEAEAHDKSAPRFFFLFGREDHWVADHVRDAFIARRQQRPEATRVQVDEGTLPHAFCIRKLPLQGCHSRPVANMQNIRSQRDCCREGVGLDQ